MIEALSKRAIKFYQISLIISMIATLAVIFYFWKLGFIDGSKGKDLHQASFILETYESKNILQEIKTLILNENPKLAIEKTKDVEADFEKIHSQVEVNEFEQLKISLQRSKTSAANMISFTKIDKVINVFNQKMDNFYGFVKKNNWKTLTRMSDRVFSLTNGHINKEGISKLVSQLEREFEMMTKITERSVLTSSEKSEILSRINSLKTEVTMLKKYAEERRFYFQLHGETQKAITNWLKAVAPELTLQKLKIEQIGRYYVMGLLGILVLLAVFFFTGILVSRYNLKKSQVQLESYIKNLVTELFQHGREYDLSPFTLGFQDYLSDMGNYFKKRMSFGAIFQDALPLSSVLLDENLKVIWSNKNFSQNWDISEEDLGKDYMSWDYLSKLTNIGPEDPVLEALKNEIAGIYQIQVKPSEKHDSRAYEMFVAPVKFQGEKKVMLFFYDLTNLEQTIKDQANGLVVPIKKSLRLSMQGKFLEDETLENAFSIVGASDIYQQISELNEYFMGLENQLLKNIEMLNQHIDQQSDIESKAKLLSEKSFSYTKDCFEALKVFKSNVIELSGASHKVSDILEKNQEVLYANITALTNSSKKINSLKESSRQLCESMEKVSVLKEALKEMKQKVEESRSKFSHDFSQLALNLKSSNSPSALEKLTKSTAKAQNSFHELSQNTDDLFKKLGQFDIYSSKSLLLMRSAQAESERINAQYEQQQVNFTQQEVKSLKRLHDHSLQIIEESEAEVVDAMRNMFLASKEDIQGMSEILRLFAQTNQSETSSIHNTNS